MTEEERKLEAHHVEEEIPAVAPTCTSTGLTCKASAVQFAERL